jgi:hypothetical protein
MTASRFVVIDGCPVPRALAPAIRELKHDVPSARLNSCYRGRRAKGLLHRLGKRTQAELYDGFRRGLAGYLPANPPGRSTHELRSDGVAYRGPVGRPLLSGWKCGMDFNDQDVPKLLAAARKRGWALRQPYRSGSEYHHLNFAKRPRVKRRRKR